MKILTIVGELGKGGTERAAQNFALAYKELGHDSRILALNSLGLRYDEIKKDIEVYHKISKENSVQLKNLDLDLVHIHSHGCTFDDVCKVISIIDKSKTIIVETNVFSSPSKWENYLHLSYQLSDWALKLYRLRGGLVKNSVFLPYPVKHVGFRKSDVDYVIRFKEKYNIPLDSRVIGRIGQHYEGKWSSVLIDVFNQVIKVIPNLSLVLVNPPESIRSQKTKSGFSDRIIIIDQLIGDEELSVAYSSFDVFCLTADQGESFGMVLVESILCETPVVVLDTPWGDNTQCEIVEKTNSGLIGRNSREIKNHIVSILNNVAIVDTQKSRSKVIELFDYLKVANDSIALVIECKEKLELKLDQTSYFRKVFNFFCLILLKIKLFTSFHFFRSNYKYRLINKFLPKGFRLDY